MRCNLLIELPDKLSESGGKKQCVLIGKKNNRYPSSKMKVSAVTHRTFQKDKSCPYFITEGGIFIAIAFQFTKKKG